MQVIYKRRSIRKYTSQPIDNVLLIKLLRAAMYAPSACNQQDWQFVLITKREVLDALSTIGNNSAMLKEAQAAIVVCGDLELEVRKGYWVQDCSASTQNILLEATELGLGSVWLGIFPREDRIAAVKRMLNLPAHVIPLSIVSLGYPAEEKETPDRYKEGRVHYDSW